MIKLLSILKAFGVKYLVSKLVHLFLKKMRIYTEVELIKEKLVKRFTGDSFYTVKYGGFAGLKMHQKVWWGKYDVINKVYGNYESQVVSVIQNYRGRRTFIDIGAADGYYATGVVISGLFEELYALRRLLKEEM